VLVVLGDTIDRGAHTKECLEFLARLREKGREPVLVVGNHELLLLDALRGDVQSLDTWLTPGFGSEATLRSYGFDPTRIGTLGTVLRIDGKAVRSQEDVERSLLDLLGERHLALLKRSRTSVTLTDFYPGVDAFCCHGGLTPGLTIGETSRSQLAWGSEAWIKRRTAHPENLVIVHGHFHGGTVIVRHKALCLAIEGAVAVLSCEEHVIATSRGELIEIRRETLGV
jgi:serine/threonine protein phosphatase 1